MSVSTQSTRVSHPRRDAINRQQCPPQQFALAVARSHHPSRRKGFVLTEPFEQRDLQKS